jgi:hypothetical protein
MGEAKRRRMRSNQLVYHHTSTLRTNLIWMSGYLQTEDQCRPPLHPTLGLLQQNPLYRRKMVDFPPLVWFTSHREVPGCLRNMTLRVGDTIEHHQGDVTDFIALHRIALGFSKTHFVRWPEYFGYATAEGRELNESAREYGDNPDDWYISEVPVDVSHAEEVLISPTKYNQKLKRSDKYLSAVRNMVALCRAHPNSFIPPSWMDPEDAKSAASEVFGCPVIMADDSALRAMR